MNVPANLKYTEHDEWVSKDGDVLTIGITDYAQDALGELVHVELPSEGDTFESGDAICEVESVKAVAEVYTPVAGEVVAVNESIVDAAESINKDPYGCWLIKLRIADGFDIDHLMDAAAYTTKTARK